MKKPSCRAGCAVDKDGHGPHNYQYHSFLAADWIETNIGFDTGRHRAILNGFPRKRYTKAVLKELKAHLYAATGMHPQHYAAIYHQIASAEALLGDVADEAPNAGSLS